MRDRHHQRITTVGTLVVLSIFACSRSPNQKFFDDAAAHGVPNSTTMVTFGTGQGVGDRICSDARAGKDLFGTTNQLAENPRWAMTKDQARVTVYWAVHDLCPDQIGKTTDFWKDAVIHPNPAPG